MIATLFLAALVSQTPVVDGTISGTVVDAVSGKPAANVRVILARTNIAPAQSIRIPLSGNRSTADVVLPGEWWNQIADKSAVDALTAARLSRFDIRQIVIRPDGGVAIVLADPVTTDDQGMFVFSHVRPGNYRLITVVNGHVSPEYRGPGEIDSLVLTAGQSINLQLPALPTGAVSGRIRDQSGEPIPDITVQLVRPAYDAMGRKKLQVAGFTHTNDRGEYRIFFVPPGRYYLQAGSSYGSLTPSSSDLAAMAADHTVQDSFVNSFFPGGHDIDSASAIEVKPGANLDGLDFSLSRFPVFRIQGKTVNTETGKPPDSVLVLLSSGSSLGSVTGESEPIYSTGADKDGSFEFEDVPPGSYVLTFSSDNSKAVAGPFVISTSDLDLGKLSVGPGKTLLVKVRMEKDGRIPASLVLNKIGVQLSLAFIDFEAFGVHNGAASLTADGTLRLRPVVPGDYRVSLLDLPDGFYIKEMRFGETDVLQDALRLQGTTTDTLEIVLASDPGRIQGRVSDRQSRSAPGSQIVLVPDHRNRKDLFRSVIADATGRFLLTNIPPGDYKLFAWESLDPYAFFDPDVLRAVETRGVSVHVTASSTQTVNVQPIGAVP